MILRYGSVRNGDLDFCSLDENDDKFKEKLDKKLSQGWTEDSEYWERAFAETKSEMDSANFVPALNFQI